MKTPLKIGDRVKLRGFDRMARHVEGSKGEIVGQSADVSLLYVKITPNHEPVGVYPSQCIRLIKAKRRRVWLELGAVEIACNTGSSSYLTSVVRDRPGITEKTWIEFIEVKPKS